MKEIFFNVSDPKKGKVGEHGGYKVKLFEKSIQQEDSKAWLVKLSCQPAKPMGAKPKTIIDLYPLNWSVKQDQSNPFASKTMSKLISKNLSKITNDVVKKLPEKDLQVLIVLDISLQNVTYTAPEATKKLEQEFLTYIQSQNDSNLVKCLTQNRVQYIFLEGGLKADILATNLFSKNLKQHLLANKEDFCQLVEFLINSFKQGEIVTIKGDQNKAGIVFDPSDYIVKIAPEVNDFQPAAVGYTVYPSVYKQMATEGKYTRAMQQSGLFKIETEEKSDFVQMKTEKLVGVNHG